MVFKNLNRLGYQGYRFYGFNRVFVLKKVCEPLKISKRLQRIDYARQETAFGLAGFLPCARSIRYALTSAPA